MTAQVITCFHVNKHPSSSSPHTSTSTAIGEHFHVGKKIGENRLCAIFEGVNILNTVPVAIKFEPVKSDASRLFNEYQNYGILNGCTGIPQVHYYGREGLHNVLVVDLLGPNLENLFNMCGRKFSIKTVCMLAKQMITRVQCLHDKDLIHRAIKPDNFLVGVPGTHSANLIHLVDFGMAKHYRDPHSYSHIPYRERKSPSGTARYMSINAHLGREQSRRDDLESLGHVFMYFLRGGLPWQGLKAATDKQRNEKIGMKKESTPISELCGGFPEEFAIYMNYVRKLGFEESPNYDFLCSLFTKALDARGETNDLQFDWVVLNAGLGREVENTPSALLRQAKSRSGASVVTFGPIDDLSSPESNTSADLLLPDSGADPSGSRSQYPQGRGRAGGESGQREEKERIRVDGDLRIWREWEEIWKKIKGRGRKRKELNEERIRKERMEERKRNGMEVEKVRLRANKGGCIGKEQEGLEGVGEFRVVVEEDEERLRLIEVYKRKRKEVEDDPQTEEEGDIHEEGEAGRVLWMKEVEGWGKIKEGNELRRKGKVAEEDRIYGKEGDEEWLSILKGEEEERMRIEEEERSWPQKDEKRATFKASASVTARRLNSLDEVTYPEGIQSPGPGPNHDAQQDRCKYDRDFLLQLTEIRQGKHMNGLLEIFGAIRDWFNLPGEIQQLHLRSSEKTELLLSIIEHIIATIEPMKQESGTPFYLLSLCKSWIRKISRKTGVLPSSLILKDVKLVEKNPINCGGFADIYKGTYKGSPVAVKVIRTAATKATTQKYHLEVFHEALHWKHLRHEHIVSFLGVARDSFAPQIGLVSPWMTNGSVLQYLEDNPQANRETLLTHSAKGLSYLHGQTPALVHGDIKAANILVDDDGKARLSDFGLISISESQHLQTTSRMSESGSVRWMAPELIAPSQEGMTKSRTSDIYAFGMTILEVFTGAPPFFNIFKYDGQVIHAVMQGCRPTRPDNESLVSPLSDKLWEVTQRCWATDPGCRPSIEKLLLYLQALEG